MVSSEAINQTYGHVWIKWNKSCAHHRLVCVLRIIWWSLHTFPRQCTHSCTDNDIPDTHVDLRCSVVVAVDTVYDWPVSTGRPAIEYWCSKTRQTNRCCFLKKEQLLSAVIWSEGLEESNISGKWGKSHSKMGSGSTSSGLVPTALSPSTLFLVLLVFNIQGIDLTTLVLGILVSTEVCCHVIERDCEVVDSSTLMVIVMPAGCIWCCHEMHAHLWIHTSFSMNDPDLLVFYGPLCTHTHVFLSDYCLQLMQELCTDEQAGWLNTYHKWKSRVQSSPSWWSWKVIHHNDLSSALEEMIKILHHAAAALFLECLVSFEHILRSCYAHTLIKPFSLKWWIRFILTVQCQSGVIAHDNPTMLSHWLAPSTLSLARTGAQREHKSKKSTRNLQLKAGRDPID